MSVEFVVECHTGVEERLDRAELIEQLTDDYRNDLHDEIEGRVSEFQSQLANLSDDDLASEYRERTDEIVRIEAIEERVEAINTSNPENKMRHKEQPCCNCKPTGNPFVYRAGNCSTCNAVVHVCQACLAELSDERGEPIWSANEWEWQCQACGATPSETQQ